MGFQGVIITVLWMGAVIAIIVFTTITGAQLIRDRRQNQKNLLCGNWLNAAGLGFFPGLAIWKIFEGKTRLTTGISVFEPIPKMFFLTKDDGCFAPCRIEMIAAILLFAGIIVWLIIKKNELPGNGDLLMIVLVLWGMVRCVTEVLRAYPVLQFSSFRTIQIIWTAFEWLTVLSCWSVILLDTAEVITVGSKIGDFVLVAGCAALGIIICLLAAKDSRTQ